MAQRAPFLGIPNKSLHSAEDRPTSSGKANPCLSEHPLAAADSTLSGRAELGLVDKGGQVRGLWVVLLVRVQVHSHAGPLLARHGGRQLLLIRGVDHRGDDRRCFWSWQWSRILQQTRAN